MKNVYTTESRQYLLAVLLLDHGVVGIGEVRVASGKLTGHQLSRKAVIARET